MKLFFYYLKLHYKSLIMFTAFSLIFISVFYLSNVPLEAVFYALLLCFILGLIIFIISFFNFKNKHEALTHLKKSIKYSLDELPEARNIIEQDFVDLINIAYDEKAEALSEKAIKISEMTDYYTLWAHQIKTPISAMKLLLQSGEKTQDTEELENQLFKTEQYVDMVLNYIKSDFNSSDYVLKQCSIDEVVKGALHKYAKLFIRKKIALQYDGIDLSVLSDEKWLSFVIEQILSNAIKYTNEGSVKIYLEGKNTLVIEDTGIGISIDDLPRVCEKGYTGYNGRSDKKSTGIGLYLCKKILNNLSHQIVIQSQVGEGTKVKIVFNSLNMMYE